MQYNKFVIKNYRAIKGPLEVDLKNKIIPLVGINECGKTTILQAIFAFDYANDELNNGTHIHDISNLYELDDDLCEIKAFIEVKKEEIIKIIDQLISQNNNNKILNTGKMETMDQESDDWKKLNRQNLKMESFNNIFNLIKEKITNKYENNFQMEIIRELSDVNGLKYRIADKNLEKIDGYEEVEEAMAVEIVKMLPPILYSDDFNDRPDSEVILTDSGRSSEWERIYSRVFSNALNKEGYSIYSLYDVEDRRRKSTLFDVSEYLSNNLTEAWSRFSNEKKKITISFDIQEIKNESTKRILKIDIIENIDGKDRTFRISDRSKGFIWYYNFIMKIQFNPKQDLTENTIFLLDEPGSYLHETAQNELCKKLVEISKKEGVVLYCTHSPQLLNPMYIPLNTIKIVSKSKSKISCSTIGNVKTNSTKKSAFQPIYEALQIPEFSKIDDEMRIVIVEGIYDKYSLELFSDVEDKIIFFPSANAKSICDNIQYFIAFNKPYMALWDNDGEGKNSLEKAKKYFGIYESKNFYVLPDAHCKEVVRMEEMFEEEDFKMIKSILNIPENSSYEITIGTLYYSENRDELLKQIKEKISDKTKISFIKLNSIIKEHFSNY